MDIDKKISEFILKLTRYWLVCAVVAIIFIVTSTPPSVWWAAGLVGIIVSYYVTMFLGGMFFSYTVNSGQLQKYDVINEGVEIVAESPEIVGRYMGFDIHEWFDLKINGQVSRYFYDTIAPTSPRDGEKYVIPYEDGVALISGMIYRRRP